MKIKKTKYISALLVSVFILTPIISIAHDEKQDYIKWVNFNVPVQIMREALEADIGSYESPEDYNICWIDLLALLGARYGGNWKSHKAEDLNSLVNEMKSGKTISELCENAANYSYYKKAYTAVLGGLVGEYQEGNSTPDGKVEWVTRYGLRAYSPIAKGFGYGHYPDFGDVRSYGYKRRHLGHDLMAPTGTPVIAIESGVIEEMGWNRYGGWRIGIRSFDGARYYYYAHLRQNRPYAQGIENGKVVFAGDVIGYIGRTGYSGQENKNNISQSHLHLGLQLIFTPEQKEGDEQIWVDLYGLTKLLQNRRSETIRNPETKEHTRASLYREIVPENRFSPSHAPSPSPPPGTARENGHYPSAVQSSSGRAVSASMPVTAGGKTDKDNREKINLPIIMYHDIRKDYAKRGKYIITPRDFESDLKWLVQNGYTAVSVREIIDYVEGGSPLPEKPILLTFDDGHYSNVCYAEPLLGQYGMKAAIFIVGAFCDKSVAEGSQNPNFSYIHWSEQRRMVQTGLWEAESHSYNLHRRPGQGVARVRGESDEAYKKRLIGDFRRINDKIEQTTGVRPVSFAYPFGLMSDIAEEALHETGNKATFGCWSGTAGLVKGDSSSLRKMKRYLRSANTPVQKLLKD
ncbi:MAG: polysaccharide deacetylase family protein [Oscillospiraceae bacterium]|nr:polysaccharide deacetylase family protein [Oscillospiraceae bacterium]